MVNAGQNVTQPLQHMQLYPFDMKLTFVKYVVLTQHVLNSANYAFLMLTFIQYMPFISYNVS